MRVQDERARTFYTEECAKSAWSVRQPERQINTMYYQRILASQDKSLAAKEIQSAEPKPEYEKNQGPLCNGIFADCSLADSVVNSDRERPIKSFSPFAAGSTRNLNRPSLSKYLV